MTTNQNTPAPAPPAPAEEIAVFQDVWHGGYYEGDPLQPMARSGYGILGYVSILHATYLMCIRPYITKDTIALEIGPGRGAWTRGLLGAKEVWCLDARSAEDNHFWQYIGNAPHVKYFKVADFSCSDLPDNHFDYFFSFGTFCHISEEGRREYFKNLHCKLKPGARCFVMIADRNAYNRALDQVDPLCMVKPLRKSLLFKLAILPLRITWGLCGKAALKKLRWVEHDQFGNRAANIHFHHAGVPETCRMLEDLGYRIIDPNIAIVPRDPIIHFVRP